MGCREDGCWCILPDAYSTWISYVAVVSARHAQPILSSCTTVVSEQRLGRGGDLTASQSAAAADAAPRS
eukprot:2701454-Prymnesium_polylepis.1